MSTTGTSATTEQMYSQLIDDGGPGDERRTDVHHRGFPVFPARLPSGPGLYRLATVCLAALCVVLLVSIVAVTAQHQNKPQAGEEAASLMQKGEANISALASTIMNLKQENKQLQEENQELKANLTTIMTTKGTTKPPAVCQTDWHLFNNSCYLITSLTRSWRGAQIYCQGQGGHLAIILTAEEQTFIWNLLPRGYWNAYWFGITDGETEDVWKWIDGSPLVGGFWEENEPNNHINEDCGYMIKTTVLERVATKSWYDAPCYMNLPFICEKKLGS
uniref:C-type lectin domain-containing protein n=2 Tax=Nothobranchius korthausae TaxID=1143690 RepID=A0A1A8EW59_9TELE